MNLSTFVYDVVDEASKIEKNQTDSQPEQARTLFETIRKLENLNTILQIQNERFKIGEKELKSECEKLNNEFKSIFERTETLKSRCKDQTRIISEIKDYDSKIQEQQIERKKNIDNKYAEALMEIKKMIDFDPEEVEKFKTENKIMKDEIQNAIEDFKNKEIEYRKKIEGLKGEFQEMQAALGKEIEDFQKQTIEFQMLKSEKEMSRSKLDTVKQRINIYHEKVPKFFQMIEYKEKQYEKYFSEIREILVKFKVSYFEKQKNDEILKVSNVLFYELHHEVD